MAKTKLKQEHINKIESMLELDMPAKWTEVTIQISANRKPTINTGHELFTMDVLTPLLIIHYEVETREGEFIPQSLHDIRHIILGFQFSGVDGGIIEHEPTIIDVNNGVVAVVMDNQWDFSGTVYCHNYLTFLNSRSFDAGMLQMQWTKSWLDKELPQLGQLEISRFTELIMQIHTMAGLAIGEMQGQLDEFERQLLLQIGHLQSTMDGLFPIAEDLQNQIDVGGLITGEQFDELREEVSGIATEKIVGDSSWITVDESQEGKITDNLIEGRTLVNLWSDNTNMLELTNGATFDGEIISIDTSTTTHFVNFIVRDITVFKPSTTYTFVVDIMNHEEDFGILRIENSIIGITGAPHVDTPLVNGRSIRTFNTVADFEGRTQLRTFVNLGSGNGRPGITLQIRISIYEGDLTNQTLNHTLPRQFASPSNLLVSDEITDTEYIQRVVEVDLETVQPSGGVVQYDVSTRMDFHTPFSEVAGGGNLHVNCNRLPTYTPWSMDTIRVTLNAQRNTMRVNIPHNPEITLQAQFRQYLIQNDYQFLVPLAEPRRYPIRSWDLPSHEPVTHVHVDSGPVSPRTSFKIVTSIMPRLRKVENRLTNLENDFRNHIQMLARAIVQPIEKRDYRSVAELGFPEEFEIKVEEQEVDVNAE